jgi:alginate O-acetyltransferase complex protein AlgI
MLFNSLSYLFFLGLIAIIYYLIPERFRWFVLLIASIVYYLSFIPVFLSLILFITLINYYFSRWLVKVPSEKSGSVLFLIISLNILILGLFKYFNFLFPGTNVHLYNVDIFFRTDPINKMILPLGLSYITFTIISYQIEIKRKTIQPENHLGYFSLYLFFFPKIAQGPIERPQHMISQLRQSHLFNYNMVVDGLKLILWGYFKKLVVADNLGLYVNSVYNYSEKHNGISLIIATVFFAFQIYADFSGYTDIALGSAKIFGFNLTNNFSRPYFATSIKDFWSRWHISFSTWIRDYIFLPLAYYLSNRLRRTKYLFISKEKWVYLFAVIITFAICGIWHGVGWTYLIWGVLFGIFLSYSNWTGSYHKRIRKRLHIRKTTWYYLIYKTLATFILVLIAWIFFRANSLTEATSIITKIFTSPGTLFIASPANLILSLSGIATLLAVDLKQEYFQGQWAILYSKYPAVRIAGIIILVITILLIGVFDGGQFIYFLF